MDLKALANKLGELSQLEAADLAKMLEEKWGVSAKPIGFAPTPIGVEDIAPPQTEFAVILTEIGDKKIEVVKEIRDITKLGLKESKEFVETLPKTVKGSLDKESADKLQERLEKVGAKAEIH
jgi:large subunit ribosomal protein L7/L12